MSKKDDVDNRSNQMNPNNSAYASSRGGNSESNDDYDDEECNKWGRSKFFHRF